MEGVHVIICFTDKRLYNLDYQSDFDQQAVESNESPNQEGGQFESGQDATPSISGTCTHMHVHMYAICEHTWVLQIFHDKG